MKVYVRFSQFTLGFIFLGPCFGPLAPAATLTLDNYLQSVKQANRSLQISASTIAAGELRNESTDIAFSPQFFSQASHTSDRKEQVSPLSPERVEATNLNFGIQKLWESGLQTQVTYNMTRVELDQAAIAPTFNVTIPLPNPAAPGTVVPVPVSVPNPALDLLPRDEYTEARTQIDLVQPLWKNSGGKDIQLSRESSQTKIQMQKLGENYKTKNLMAQAEYVYWQLALAQEAVRNQEGTIERLRKIREWTARRAKSQLGDRVDFLQADSGLRAKLFELETTKKDRNALQRAFNTLRGVEGQTVEGGLTPLSSRTLIRDKSQTLAEVSSIKRLDIEIAKKAERISEIEIEQSREKFKGQLDVFGSVALNALDSTTADAMSDSLGTEHPTVVVGIKFSTPLDHDLINRDRQGLVQASTATRLDRENKEFTARQDYMDLGAQLAEAEQRLRLASELESAQKEKVAYERQRLDTGRTTTYQILNFENDYALSQLATIRSKAEILGILAKLKSFGDVP
ncbi:MAG: TolC family protein [Proteobacteria bacterium]|nr:MAG: TolC family protein [Pseudomonadota bacterium]